MTKLQEIKRPNGSLVYPVYIPGEIITELGLVKGDELDITTEKERIIITKARA